MDRRQFLSGLLAGLAGIAAFAGDAEAGPRARRRRRRIVRRRIRRRIRRRVVFRRFLGRPAWVVPVGLAVGWELVHEGRVVVVKEIRVVEVEGTKAEVVVVHPIDDTAVPGKPLAGEEILIVREDNEENTVELDGSRLADDDKTSPSRELEGEEVVEE